MVKFGSGGQETKCGRGSMIANTADVRELLPRLVKELGVSKMLDAACGDANWISTIDLGCDYIGWDIDPDHLKVARRKMPSGSFEQKDIRFDPIPSVDLVLLRHVLQHMTYADIFKVLGNIESAPNVLVTSHPVPENREASNFFPLNLGRPPLFLEARETFQDENLELWLI